MLTAPALPSSWPVRAISHSSNYAPEAAPPGQEREGWSARRQASPRRVRGLITYPQHTSEHHRRGSARLQPLVLSRRARSWVGASTASPSSAGNRPALSQRVAGTTSAGRCSPLGCALSACRSPSLCVPSVQKLIGCAREGKGRSGGRLGQGLGNQAWPSRAQRDGTH